MSTTILMTSLSLPDVLAVRSLTQGLELLGVDLGVWGAAAEAVALVAVAFLMGLKAGRVSLRAGRGVWGYLFPAPPPPPEPSPVVRRLFEVLDGPADWAPDAKREGAGLLNCGPLYVEINPAGQVAAMRADSQDVWMDLDDKEKVAVRAKIDEAVERARGQQRAQRQALAMSKLGGPAVFTVSYSQPSRKKAM